MLISIGASVVGCYDDSKLQEDVADLQKRVAALELLCSQMNNNIVGMQTIINSLNNNDYITAVTPIMQGEKEIGYTITFLKSKPITIYHGNDGKNGENGKDGSTPKIGVKQDTDGIWYWTNGDSWLLDENGQKVRASGIPGDPGKDGEPGVTPQLKIVDGHWYLSIDNGKNWTNLGKATGADGKDGKDGDSMFKSVTYDDKYAYFTLVNGTVLTVPMNTNVPKLQFTLDKDTDIHLTGGGSIVLNYTITCYTGANTTLTSYETNNWKVQITKSSATKGTIKITAPNPVESGKILLMLTDDYGNVFMKTLEIIGDDNIIKIIKTEYTIDEYGGYIDVAVDANISYTVQIAEEGTSWITYQGKSGSNDRFQIAANADYSSRSSIIRFKGTDGETTKDITITQLQNNAIVLTSNTVNVSENAQTYPLVIRANIDCKISIPSGVNWISNVTTKALEEKTFTLNIQENEEYASRSVIITVSDTNNKINQTITLTQSGYTPVYVNIPDATFLACLVESYDINGDGKIDQKEAKKVTSIDCSSKSISSLSGIEYFENLASLDCSKTQIASLDISSNTKLTSILCQYCESMSSLVLPPISSINDRAFISCTALTKLVLPNSVVTVGSDAFLNCSSLKDLTIQSDINTTYSKSFSGATFENLTINDKATKVINNMFSGSSYIKYVLIGEEVTTIGDYAFRNCINLSTVSFDKYSKLRTIGDGVFSGSTKLSLLDMSNCTEVSSIHTSTSYSISLFYNHSSALSIYIGTRVPPSTYRIYEYDHNYHNYFKLDLRVPGDCIDAYKSNTNWYSSSYVTISSL